ncbi:MAG: membrane protein insertase YidC [Bacteroidia bacterium]
MTYNSGSKEKELAAQKRHDDSLAQINARVLAEEAAKQKKAADSMNKVLAADTSLNKDSLEKVAVREKFGFFSDAAKGENKPVIIETDLIKASIYPKGGKIGSIELKGQLTWDKKPLVLFSNDSARFGLEFFDLNRKRFSTDSLYFTTDAQSGTVKGNEKKTVSFKLYADGKTDQYIEYVYTFTGNSYMVGCDINFVGSEKIFAADQSAIDLAWTQRMPSQEKSLKNQRQVATVFYRFDGEEDVEYLAETEDEKKNLTGELKWVSFKQQYYSAVLIAKNKFANGAITEIKTPADPFVVKNAGAILPVPFNKTAKESFGMNFYFGPNEYYELKKHDMLLERQINLGGSILGWMNRAAIMPIFSFLGDYFSNYGIVILLLTIIVKIVLFPIAYKSYLSSAKMRVLKPEINEINEKYKDKDAMQKQQATMALYRKAGVNPASGCIPLLLQIPILFALLRFFPAAFELRQAGFWWVDDLSTYDSVLDFGFSIPWYGDHVSLWALLMTISTLITTVLNQQMMDTGQQLPGMKWLIYLMPVMFLGFLNNYSAGLSYYYFISNMITFIQMMMMRRFVDEKAIHAKIEENKKKPVKTSGFMQRLEQAQKKRLEEMQKNKKK